MVTFTDFVAGDTKGEVNEGDLFNGMYGLGSMSEGRQKYTGANVVESFTATASQTVFDLNWEAALEEITPVTSPKTYRLKNGTVKVDGTATTAYTATIDATTGNGKITLASGATEGKVVAVAYTYDNVVIPQNKLVHLKAVQKNIPLEAKCRRIAITYSQIASFQAKTDYGFDLGQQLSAQATGELQYEIDSEVVQLLVDSAAVDTSLNFSRTQPVGVSLRDHYEAFARNIARAAAIIYSRTQKYQPNYMVCAVDCLDVLSMNTQFKAAPGGAVYGPYFAGTFGTLKVFVSPMMDTGKFVIGVNGSDLKTSAAVYAPYMPIIPTQLLGLPDGTMTQGFATMYDLKLLAHGTVNESTGKYTPDDNGTQSPLLVAGAITD